MKFILIPFILISASVLINPQSQIKSKDLLLTLLEADEIKGKDAENFLSIYNDILQNARDEIEEEDNIYDKHETLFDLLHSDYFKKYTEESFISRLLAKKEFNCITAVILYKMICIDTGLDVNMHETPYHVYLTVNSPAAKSFKIELTDPVDGFDAEQNIDDLVEELIEYLLEYKLITEEELKTKGRNSVYNEYLSDTHLINTDNLAAAYYSNIAFYNALKNKTYEAFKLIKQAVSIAPDSAKYEKYRSIWQYHINNIRMNPDSTTAFLLETIDSIPPTNEFRESMVDASVVIIELNVESNNFDIADSVYNRLCSVLPPDYISGNTLRQTDIYIKAGRIRSKSIRGDNEEAFKLASDLFHKHKDNDNVLDLYLFTGNYYMQNLGLSGNNTKLLEIADSMFTNVPDIKSVEDSYARACIQNVVNTGLYKTDPGKSKEILLEAYSRIPDNNIIIRTMCYIYHELAMAEIRNRNYKKAVDLLNEGLSYDPENFELKRELTLTKELLNKR